MIQQTDSSTATQKACDALVASIAEEANDGPMYLCVWGDGYAEPGQPIIGVHLFGFFSDENGYSDRNREAIRALSYGESVTITGLADVQSVVRVQ
jgi:hypothetical protein